eukprot:XP_015578376.1 uncharacterized protein LOC107261728 [Ricinus communis]
MATMRTVGFVGNACSVAAIFVSCFKNIDVQLGVGEQLGSKTNSWLANYQMNGIFCDLARFSLAIKAPITLGTVCPAKERDVKHVFVAERDVYVLANDAIIAITNSEYYIHPNENPALMLTSSQLIGNNYYSWARSMKMSLISKNKFRFVNGSIKVPREEDPSYNAWLKCNNLVLSWLQRSLNTKIGQSEFFFLQQGILFVTAYHTHLKILWDEICNLRPLHACECSANKYRKQDFILKFLKGLNVNFSVQRSQILMMKPMPLVNEIFAIVIQHERSLSAAIVSCDSNILLAGKFNINTGSRATGFNLGHNQHLKNMNGFRPKMGNQQLNLGNSQKRFFGNYGIFPNNRAKKPTCTSYGMYGHPVDKCYRKNGFPSGYKGTTKNFQNSTNQVASFPSDDNNFLTTEQLAYHMNYDNHNSFNKSGDDGPITFTKDQYNSLMSIIQEKAVNSHNAANSQINALSSVFDPIAEKGTVLCCYKQFYNRKWIADSGATDHITNSLSFFKRHYKVFDKNVKLLNNELVQDMKLWKMTGIAKQVNGLYQLLQQEDSEKFLNSFPVSCNVVAFTLWHNRLGHPSKQVMKSLDKFHNAVTPTPVLNQSTPFEILFKVKPSYDQLKVFSCLAFASVLPHPTTKMHPRAIKCVFIGFPKNTKGYRVYNLENKSIFVSSDVTFTENKFPFKEIFATIPSNDVLIPVYQNESSLEDFKKADSHTVDPLHSSTVEIQSPPINSTIIPQLSPRPARNIHLPSKFHDVEVSLSKPRTTLHCISQVLSYEKIPPQFQSYICNTSILPEPKHYN